MSTAQFCVSWMSYKNSISKGFSRFQQSGEFVDMTLAAEGHLVKVHQNIVALASPYLKAMIQSAQCQHPVVFLNNISHEILSYILEYIYTGEANIPTEMISAFIDVCRALCINGVENLVLPKKIHLESVPEESNTPFEERLAEPPEINDNNFAAHITINNDNNVEVVPIENNNMQDKTVTIISLDNVELIKHPTLPCTTTVESKSYTDQDDTYPAISLGVIEIHSDHSSVSVANTEENQNKNVPNIHHNTSEPSKQSATINLNSNESPPTKTSNVRTLPPSIGDKDRAQHYTISNRGSLQLMLNRFMYYCHHHSCEGRKRRWRCVDYRKLHCPAYIDTDNDSIVNRSEAHTHNYHDTKIMRKFKSKLVFTSFSQAEEKVNTVKQKSPKVVRSKKREISLWSNMSTL